MSAKQLNLFEGKSDENSIIKKGKNIKKIYFKSNKNV
jgi:hypothetical protein